MSEEKTINDKEERNGNKLGGKNNKVGCRWKVKASIYEND